MKERIRGLLIHNGPGTAAQVATWLGVPVGRAATMADALTERGDLRRDLVQEGRTSYYLYSVSKTPAPEQSRLCITRRVGQSVVLQLPDGREMTVYLSEIRTGDARLHFMGPKDVKIYRDELLTGVRG
jgi:sRNA-binding carbon storage regulator CsrA